MYSVASLLAFIGIYLLTALTLSSITVDAVPSDQSDVDIYILTNGVHTDIVVPARNKYTNWTNDIRYEHTNGKDSTTNWIAFGWGDKGFYLQTPTWADLKASVAFNAAFGFSTSAVHATHYKAVRESASCRKISISARQYAQLVTYINESFERDEEGKIQYIKTTANYGATDAFYEAKGSYSLFRTCNTWANNALKAAEQKACYWTAFDKPIFRKYE